MYKFWGRSISTFVLFFFALLSFAGNPDPSLCRPSTALSKLVVKSTRDFYDVNAPGKMGLYAKAGMKDRTLFLGFQTRGENGERYALLKGSEQFDAVLKHFEGRFDKIAGNWRGSGDNLDSLNALTKGPDALPLEKAAEKTWTGQQAIRNGYTKVKVSLKNGKAGAYTHVIVTFERP